MTKPSAKRSRSSKKTPKTNEAVAEAFDEMKLYEAHTGGHYKGRIYSKVADAVRRQRKPLTAGKQVANESGVGPKSVEKIDEFLKIGHITKLDNYRKASGALPKAGTAPLKDHGIGPDGEEPVTHLRPETLRKIKKRRQEFAKHDVPELQRILRHNNGKVTGSKAELTLRCAEGAELGAFADCPLCHHGKPAIDFKRREYVCPGYMDGDQFVPCFFVAGHMKRPAWSLPSSAREESNG